MDFAFTFFDAFGTTLITGAIARFLAGYFTVQSRPGSIAFCLTAGFAFGRIEEGSGLNREQTLELLAVAGGGALALVILYWLLVKRAPGEPY